MHYGCHSMVDPIKSILLKHPADAFLHQTHLEEHWRSFGYLSCPDYGMALREYTFFEECLRQHIPELLYLPRNENTGLDAIYTHDPVKITRKGAILMHMGKSLRRGEPAAVESFLQQQGIPVLGTIRPPGRMEGGDVVWLDEHTVAVGLGYRTNVAGIDQFKDLVADFVDTVVVVPLPHAGGPEECLHLMSLVSLLSHDLALVYSHYLPVFFRNLLIEMGLKLIEVAENEYGTLGGNVLTIAPGICLALEGNPVTTQRIRKHGLELIHYTGNEISLMGNGGPTCLTCPITRRR